MEKALLQYGAKCCERSDSRKKTIETTTNPETSELNMENSNYQSLNSKSFLD
jgi:hypothetical protein